MGAKSGKSRKSAGVKRLGLIVFGAVFVVLFAIFAVAQGIGEPSVPSGDAAIVKGVPDGNISEAEFKRTLAQQIAAGGLKKAPKPGSKKAEELKEAALGELLDSIWIAGEAEELGITVTDKQIETELAQIKKTNFPTAKAYKEFLDTSGFNQEDVDNRVELQLLSTEVQEQISNQAPPPSSAEIVDSYNTSKATQFTTKPTRDIRLIINKDKAKVEAAKEALEKDSSDANWKAVAGKYSTDPTTASKGGLTKGISEEVLQGAVKKAIFDSNTGEIVGPVSYQGNFLLVEPVKLNPEKVQTLAEVKSQISTQLAQQKQQEFFNEFVSDYQSKWTSRTYCASDFLIERCANFKGSGHPASASPACYEADPKVPPTECPAPVEQTKPALPGSVTAAKPLGERLVQRPRPEAKAKAAAGKGAAEALEKVAPETGE